MNIATANSHKFNAKKENTISRLKKNILGVWRDKTDKNKPLCKMRIIENYVSWDRVQGKRKWKIVKVKSLKNVPEYETITFYFEDNDNILVQKEDFGKGKNKSSMISYGKIYLEDFNTLYIVGMIPGNTIVEYHRVK